MQSVFHIAVSVLLAAAPPSIVHGRGLSPAVAGPEGQRAFDDLAKCYETGTEPYYTDALDNLSWRAEADEKARRASGAYIHALLVQLMADETNGRARWQSLPWWGGGAVSRAREFRQNLAQRFGGAASKSEALDAALWLIDKENIEEGPACGVNVLRRIESAQVVEAFRRILSQPHPNEAALVGAVEGAAERKMTELASAVLVLRNHYRRPVREAVRTALPKLDVPTKPARFVPEDAFTDSLTTQLTDIAAMVLTPIPRDAKWMRFTCTARDRDGAGKPPETSQFSAWLLKSTGTNLYVLDWFAREVTQDKSQTTAEERTWADEAKQLLAIRSEKSRDALFSLSRGGSLTGQFEPGTVTIPELLVAAWSCARGDKTAAGVVLFPRISEVRDDRWLTWTSRDLLGHLYYQEMLRAFSHERDYGRVIALADHLGKTLFDGYPYQGSAKELHQQLRKRGDDIKKLRLPTEDEWARLKKDMTRERQIIYLAERLRLLNCEQCSEPGGVKYGDKQYSVPFSVLWNTSDDWKYAEVINPYNELAGMRLAVRDLPVLVTYLADDSFMPTYSFWRSFHPSRTLHRVNWVVAKLVNATARRNLANLVSYQMLEEEEKQEHIRHIIEWCQENRDKAEEQLVLETVRVSSDWSEFSRAAREAAAKGYKAALPAVISKHDLFDRHYGEMTEIAFDLSTPEAVASARRWVKDKEEGVRFWAALILLTHGDRGELEGLAELKSILEGDHGADWYPLAIDALLATRDEKLAALACGILKKEYFDRTFPGQILRSLFLAGRGECLDYLLSQLRSEGNGAKGDECASLLAAWRTDAYEFSREWPLDKRKAERERLAQWLREQFDLIGAGKEHGIREDHERIRLPEWRLDAP